MIRATVCFPFELSDGREVEITAEVWSGSPDRFTSSGWVQGEPATMHTFTACDETGSEVTQQVNDDDAARIEDRAVERADEDYRAVEDLEDDHDDFS